MPTHLASVTVDSRDPAGLAGFWSSATGWPAAEHDPTGWWRVQPPAGTPGLAIDLVKVDDPRVGKNRVHLDVASGPGAEQQAIVDRLLAAGGTHADIGQGDVPWAVLADPEGNELCVLEHRPAFDGRGPLAGIVVDSVDVEAAARFWEAATAWPTRRLSERTIALSSPSGTGPFLAFVQTGEPKVVKNRVHLDLAPDATGDQGTEVQRLIDLGAGAVDVGQGPDVPWVVLADPEGNELCVLAVGAD